MRLYTSKCLEEFKHMVDDQFVHFSFFEFNEFSKVYPFTNECISRQLGIVNLGISTKALTILSSGDHAFNLVSKGVRNIDTFDINRLTEYYALGLKRTLLTELSYEEFLKFVGAISYQTGYKLISYEKLKENTSYINQTVSDMTSKMDKDYRDFWRGVLDYFNKLKKEDGELELFSYIARGREDDLKRVRSNNKYLSSEEEYNKFKSMLEKANISFKYSNVLSLPNTFEGNSYDFISLSNTLDYMEEQFGKDWDLSKLDDFLSKIEDICTENSTIFINSILPRRSIEVNRGTLPVFRSSSVYKDNLGDLEYKEFSGSFHRQGVVLKKVKKDSGLLCKK